MARALGPIVAEYAIENAAKDLLSPERGLIGWYLDEITYQEAARSIGLDTEAVDRATVEAALANAGVNIDRTERPRSVRCRERVRKFADDQLPCILLVCPGTVGDLDRGGDGMYSGTWMLGVIAVVQTTDENLGRELAGILCAAACAVIEHNLSSVDDRVGAVNLVATNRNDNDVDDARARNTAARELHVRVNDILWSYGTPPALELFDPLLSDPAPDAGDLVTVQTTDLTTTPVEEIPA